MSLAPHALSRPFPAQAPEIVALRRARLSLVRTHNELAKVELRDKAYEQAEVQYKAALAKCAQIFGELSPEAGEDLLFVLSVCVLRLCVCVSFVTPRRPERELESNQLVYGCSPYLTSRDLGGSGGRRCL